MPGRQRTRRNRGYAENVFVNCPFDRQYEDFFYALFFTIYDCGFVARSALEIDDAGQVRIEKIYEVIRRSKYSIHDISRTELDPDHQLPRFNMPLELGIFLGAKEYGGPSQRQKRSLILDTERYRYQKLLRVAPRSRDGISRSWTNCQRCASWAIWIQMICRT